jgi:hypothetical protein
MQTLLHNRSSEAEQCTARNFATSAWTSRGTRLDNESFLGTVDDGRCPNTTLALDAECCERASCGMDCLEDGSTVSQTGAGARVVAADCDRRSEDRADEGRKSGEAFGRATDDGNAASIAVDKPSNNASNFATMASASITQTPKPPAR